MSVAGRDIAQRIRVALDDLGEHAKTQPAEVDAIVCALVAHLRSWRPEAVAPLGTLPPPGETIRDPRLG